MNQKRSPSQPKAKAIPETSFSYFTPLLLFIILIIAIRAQAQVPVLQIDGPISSGGPGCPNESVNVTFTPDMSAFSILFDRMTSQPAPRTIDLKECQISVPVYLEPGYRIRLAQVDHRGYVALQQGDRSEFTSSFYWTGGEMCSQGRCVRSKPMSMVKSFRGPMDAPLLETLYGDKRWEASACGGHMKLEIDTSMKVLTRDGAAVMVLDSIDASLGGGNAIYHLVYEKCEDIRRPREDRPPSPPRRPERPQRPLPPARPGRPFQEPVRGGGSVVIHQYGR